MVCKRRVRYNSYSSFMFVITLPETWLMFCLPKCKKFWEYSLNDSQNIQMLSIIINFNHSGKHCSYHSVYFHLLFCLIYWLQSVCMHSTDSIIELLCRYMHVSNLHLKFKKCFDKERTETQGYIYQLPENWVYAWILYTYDVICHNLLIMVKTDEF